MKFSSWYRYGEKVLYDHLKNAERLAKYQEELSEIELHGDIGIQGYSDRGGYSGFVSDRVADYVHRTEVLRKRIAELGIKVKAVEKLRYVLMKRLVCDEAFCKEASAVLESWYLRHEDSVAGISKANTESVRHWLVKRVSRYIDRLRAEKA